MNKEIDLIDVLYFIRTADINEINRMYSRMEQRRLDMQGVEYKTIKVRNARQHIRNGMQINIAVALYEQHIVDELIKEGFIYKKDNKFYKVDNE